MADGKRAKICNLCKGAKYVNYGKRAMARASSESRMVLLLVMVLVLILNG